MERKQKTYSIRYGSYDGENEKKIIQTIVHVQNKTKKLYNIQCAIVIKYVLSVLADKHTTSFIAILFTKLNMSSNVGH